MTQHFNQTQKKIIALYSDLLDDPLTFEEKTLVSNTLSDAGWSLDCISRSLPKEVQRKTESLLSQGLKLSFELGKLSQRGVYIDFPGSPLFERFNPVFNSQPKLLFVAGNKELASMRLPVAFSLSAFNNLSDGGILIADRPFDCLLRNGGIAEAIRDSRVLVISDAYKSRASVKGSDPSEAKRKASAHREASKKVFISGSRSQSAIPSSFQASLVAIIGQEIHILIGDSKKGVDSEVADFLRAPLYPYVTLFTVSAYPRIEPEAEWLLEKVESDPSLKPQERQMAKDRLMAKKADWGLCLFNPIEKNRYGALQVSSGTLRNAIQMLLEKKPVKFFYLYGSEILSRNLMQLQDLEDVITSYEREPLTEDVRKSILSAKGVSPSSDAASAKCEAIRKKYQSLLKAERKLRTSGESDANRQRQAPTMRPLF